MKDLNSLYGVYFYLGLREGWELGSRLRLGLELWLWLAIEIGLALGLGPRLALGLGIGLGLKLGPIIPTELWIDVRLRKYDWRKGYI